MTDVPRRALRQPRSLSLEQLGNDNTVLAATPTAVKAWISWDHGEEEQVAAEATAWTSRAVRVVFGVPPRRFEVWVWAGAVTRA